MNSTLTVVFDTETTGLTLHPAAPLSKQPKIIEFGAALIDADGAIVDQMNVLIHPGEEVSAEITKITGITNEMLVGAPPFSAFVEQIAAFFSRAGVVIAHNLPFDRAMLSNECARIAFDFQWPPVGVCTVGANREEWGRNPKLTELYQAVLGKPLAQTHRAIDDVLALVEVVVAQELNKP